MKFSEWIKHQKCLCQKEFGFECMGDVVGHHVKAKGIGGKRKPEFDFWNLVPLCYYHHRQVHDKSAFQFEQKYGINLKEKAQNYYEKYATFEDVVRRFYESTLGEK